ncbi:uncharacterized protein LOC62_03G003876 [Vanrija pseudolonga]|uniref:Uncharacterized protein n=1 Tax=Vanrija pseudolonga TaxID=143232 RepID=A0AAF0Y918_9TREE|nr:hypothetical protein LOC62_03G003876 [Vanrija pseudolonga]
MYDAPPYAATTLVVCPRFGLPSHLGPGVLFAANVHVPHVPPGTRKLVLRVSCDDALSHPGAYGAFHGVDLGPWVARVVIAFDGRSRATEPEYPRARTLCMAASVAALVISSRARFTLLDVGTWDSVWMWPWPRDVVFDDDAPDLAALFRATFVQTAEREFALDNGDIERAWSRVEFASRDEYRREIGEETWVDEWWDLGPVETGQL